MTGYVRKDTSNNIADGNIINSADLDAEFDGVVDAFNASTGHKHDGTTAEGAPITAVGPTQDVTVSASLVAPKTTNTVDIGSSSLKFKDIYITGTATLPTVNATTVDTTNIEVTNIKAKDGTAAMSIADTTGVVSLTANPVLSGGTANGVAYLNGSKVLTTGSALTFTGTALGVNVATPLSALHVVDGGGVLRTFDNTDGIILTSYSSSKSIGFSTSSAGNYGSDGGSNTFLKLTPGASGTMIFGASGSEQMRLTSTGLGIGTSSPGAKLHVAATAALSSIFESSNASGGYVQSKLGSAGATNGYWGAANQIITTGAAGEFGIRAETALVFSSGGATERMRLDSSGNLGLGVTPSAWAFFTGNLELNNGNTFSGNAAQNSLTQNAYYGSGGWTYKTTAAASRYQQISGAHAWHTAASGTAGNAISFTQAMTLDASGNLGIGPTSVAARLHVTAANVAGNDNVGNVFIATTDAQATDVGGKLTLGGLYNTVGSYAFAGIAGRKENSTGNNVAGYLQLLTTSPGGTLIERARIDSSGNLLVGGTAAVLSSKLLSKFSGASSNGAVLDETANTSNTTFLAFSNAGTAIGSVTRIGATSAVAYNTTSDKRLKSNIESAEPILQKLLQVQVRQYDWTEGALHQDYGFIAQELEPIFANVVTKGKTENDLWQLDYSKLTPHLVKAIQEQQAIIETLTARVAALESK